MIVVLLPTWLCVIAVGHRNYVEQKHIQHRVQRHFLLHENGIADVTIRLSEENERDFKDKTSFKILLILDERGLTEGRTGAPSAKK